MRTLHALGPAIGAALATLIGASGGAVAGAPLPTMIIGGEAAPDMTSVGALLHAGEWFCTATVIAPRAVLTAAHCLSDLSSPEGIQFFLGPDANHLESGRAIDVTELHVHPDYASTDNADIAVAVLAEDAGVDPIAVNTQTLGSDAIGQPMTLVGYGFVVQDQEGGERRKVVIDIAGVSDYFVDYATPGKNTCQGDSGGPALVFDAGGIASILGVTSYGDAECAVDGHNTRADVFQAFVGAFLDGSWSSDPAVSDPGQIPIEPGTDPDDGEGDIDFCDAFGWYSDGVCDECPTPDPDCADGEDPSGDGSDDSGCAGAPGAPDGLAAIALGAAGLALLRAITRRRSGLLR